MDEGGQAHGPPPAQRRRRRAGGVPPLGRRRRLYLAALVWLLLAAAAWYWASRHPEGPEGALTGLLTAAETPRGALGILLLAFVLRPATLLPTTVLSAFAGFLLGAAGGFVVASLAVVATALLPYGAAWMLRGRTLRPPSRGWRSELAHRPFLAIVGARLALLPGDLVSAAAGLLRVPLLPFLAATATGGSPGVLVAALAGASLRGSRFSVGALQLDYRLLAAAGVVLAASLALAWLLRQRPRADRVVSGAPPVAGALGSAEDEAAALWADAAPLRADAAPLRADAAALQSDAAPPQSCGDRET
jgi:uncharacterized membrane protein YdjX (TVP38/TMEM64 family)